MGTASAPLMIVEWDPSNLGDRFGGYSLWSRPTRAVAEPWGQLAWMPPPQGRAPAIVEDQHTKFIAYRLGWRNAGVSAIGRWEDGWDVAVAAHDALTGRATRLDDADVSGVVVTGDAHPWLVSDARPELNQPLIKTEEAKGSHPRRRIDHEIVGRGLTTARVQVELPTREYDVSTMLLDAVGEDQLRYLRAAAASGEQMCLHLPLGDRICGVLDAPKDFTHTDELQLAVTFNLVETGRPPAVPLTPADINVPAGVVLDGSSQYVKVAHSSALTPGSGPFSLVVLCVPANFAGSRWMATKGNLGTADGIGIGTTGNSDEVQGVVAGASATATLTHASSLYSDGDPRGHVFEITSDGTDQRLYADGIEVDDAQVTTGAISNVLGLIFGANNDGAAGWMAADPMIAGAYYSKKHTADEAAAAAHYLLGHPGYRMPADSIECFLDARHKDCWNGISAIWKDLTGKRRHGTVTGGPPTRGIVRALNELELHG